MSMNLHIKCGKEKLDIWQTPTQITYMCLVDAEGNIGELTGKAAIRAVRCYMEWVKGRINGSWTDEEAYQDMKSSINEHIAYYEEMLGSGKNFTVYSL